MTELKYKANDKVRIVYTDYAERGFRIGTVHEVSRVDYPFVFLKENNGNDPAFHICEIEPAELQNQTIASLKIDVNANEANAAMKELADHAERAAAALDRIKEALK